MEGLRKKLAASGIFAVFFFAAFAILVSFHHHESAASESPSHHCAVCHSASNSKVTTNRPTVFVAPELAFEYLGPVEISQAFIGAERGNDPIRGPPFA
jgi:hypothetical protein